MPNAFIAKKHEPRLNNKVWDQYYYDVKIVEVVKKTGEGEEDYTLVKKLVTDKKLIKEIIDAQAKEVGLNNILERFSLTGDRSLLPGNVSDDGTVADYSSMPQDLVEADNYFKSMRERFDALPDELKQGRDFNSFMATITQAQFDAWYKSIQPKKEEEAPKKEGD